MKLTCASCERKIVGGFKGPDTPGADFSMFHGCELAAPFVGIQDKTPACRRYRENQDASIATKMNTAIA